MAMHRYTYTHTQGNVFIICILYIFFLAIFGNKCFLFDQETKYSSFLLLNNIF